MIQELASRVVKWLERDGAISDKESELFSYALYSLLFGLAPVFIVVILGFLFGMLPEGLLMIVPFMLIRKFAGGYHLNSSKCCAILSTALIALSMGCVKVIYQGGYMPLLMVVVSLSTICIWVFSPVVSSSRKLTLKERRIFQKISRAVAIVSLIGFFVMRYTIPIQYAAAFGVGISLTAVLQIAGFNEKNRRTI